MLLLMLMLLISVNYCELDMMGMHIFRIYRSYHKCLILLACFSNATDFPFFHTFLNFVKCSLISTFLVT